MPLVIRVPRALLVKHPRRSSRNMPTSPSRVAAVRRALLDRLQRADEAFVPGQLRRWICDTPEGRALFTDRQPLHDDVIVSAVLSCLGERGMDRHVRLLLSRALGLTKSHKEVLFYDALSMPERHEYVRVLCSTLYRDCLREREYDDVLRWLPSQIARAEVRGCRSSLAHMEDLLCTLTRIVDGKRVNDGGSGGRSSPHAVESE